MPEYIIEWNAGYGKNYDIVEAKNKEEADKMAYEQWRDDAESNAEYGTIGEATKELKEEYGL